MSKNPSVIESRAFRMFLGEQLWLQLESELDVSLHRAIYSQLVNHLDNSFVPLYDLLRSRVPSYKI